MNVSNFTTVQPTMNRLMADMRADAERMDNIFRKVLIVQGTLSTIANVTVVSIFMLMGQISKRFSNYLLFCTAMADLFVSAVSWYAYYTSLLSMTPSPELDDVQLSLYALYDYSFVLCLGTLLISSLERWFSVSTPIRHQEITNNGCAKTIILPVWIIAALPPLVRLGLANFDMNQFYSSTDRIFNICFRSILIGLVFIIMIILTMTCIKTTTMIRHHRNIGNDRQGEQHTNDKLSSYKQNSRVIKIFITMIITFGVTFLPITIAMFMHYTGALDHMKRTDELALTIFCDVFFFSSSLINPIITLSFHTDYRQSLVSFFSCHRGESFVAGDTFQMRDTELDTVNDRQ